MGREATIGLVVLAVVVASAYWLVQQGSRAEIDLRPDYVEQHFGSETRALVASNALDSDAGPGRSVDRGELLRLAVRVTTLDPEGNPAPNVRFQYGLASMRADPVFATTDAAGEAEVEIRQPQRKRRAQDVAWTELAMPGHPRLRAERTVTPIHLAGDTLTLKLTVAPGRTIEGLVRTPNGESVAGAELRIGHSPTSFTEIRTDANGGWFVHVRPNLEELWLHARRLHLGASELRRVDVAGLPEDELVELVLEGPESIEGRLVDSFGFVQRRLGIDVRVHGAPELLEDHDLVSLERQGGLAKSVVGLGSGGKFSIRGLQLASYDLSVNGTLLRPPLLPGGEWVLPVGGFYLNVYTDGGRVSFADLMDTYLDEEGRLVDYDFRVARSDEFGNLGAIRIPDMELTPDQRLAVLLREPGEYVLAATHPFGDRDIVRVTLPELGEHPTVLVNLSTGGLATLRPRLPTLRDLPLDEGETLEDWLAFSMLRVTDEDTGFEVRELVSFEEAFSVPSGSYLVELLPFGSPALTGRVTIGPGEDREVLLRAEVGAELEIVLDSRQPLLDVYLTARLISLPGTQSRVIEAHLQSEGTELPSGSSYRARVPVRPGSYELQLRIDEGEILTGSFLALEGEVAEVRLSR